MLDNGFCEPVFWILLCKDFLSLPTWSYVFLDISAFKVSSRPLGVILIIIYVK